MCCSFVTRSRACSPTTGIDFASAPTGCRRRGRSRTGDGRRPSVDFHDIDDVEAWLGSNDQVRDFMTRSLMARVVDVGPDVRPVRTTSAEVSPEQVAQVKAALARFYFVGLVENAEDFLFLYGQMGMRWSTPRQKVSRSDGPDLRGYRPLVEASNRADRVVYEHAATLNGRFKAAHPEFQDVVRATRVAHDRLAPLHALAFRSRDYLSRRFKRFNRLRP